MPGASVAAALQTVLRDEAFVSGYFAYPTGTRGLSALRSVARYIGRWGRYVATYANESRPIPATIHDRTFLRLCGAGRVIGLPILESLSNLTVGEASNFSQLDATVKWQPT